MNFKCKGCIHFLPPRNCSICQLDGSSCSYFSPKEKYRAKSADTGECVCGILRTGHSELAHGPYAIIEDDSIPAVSPDPEFPSSSLSGQRINVVLSATVMKFTGTFDADGNEIYESIK